MTVGRAPLTHRDVSPLELFFDLVFVLAIGQLTHHLIQHLTWRGAAEGLIMLVAVCGVWAFTSFEVTLLDIDRAATKVITVMVMGLGLFMNSGIAHAFDDGPWLFVVPMLMALAGPGVYAAAITDHNSDVLTLLMAAGGFVAVICLWAVYFGGPEQQVLSHARQTADPIHAVHTGINVIYGVLAGLVVFAVGIEILLARAHGADAGVAGVLVLAGPAIYLVSQAVFWRIETGAGWMTRALGAAVLSACACVAFWLPAYAVILLLVISLVGLAVYLSRGRHARGDAPS